MNALHLLIRQLKAEMDEPDMEALILATLDAIDADEFGEMLQLSLRDSVHRVLSQDRPFAPRQRIPVAGVRRPVTSWRRDTIRQHWRGELRDWVSVGAGRKLLGDCTRVDLDTMAARRFTGAKALQEAGERYASLALELASADVATVAELSPEVLDRIFGAAV